MKIIVQKFGGTSVSTIEKRNFVIEKVENAIKEGYSPVVVVSAMGRKGEPYATDTLLSLINDDFKALNKQAADLLMGCGEIISSVVMSENLSKRGIKAIPLTGGQAGIITNSNFSEADVVKTDTARLMNLLKEGYVPVVTGFQGVDEEGYLTTLGRGGSDTSAAILGVALNAEEIQIFTDVDGIMTADPRIVEDAALIDEISYNEVFQFADQGAKVIHPRAVDVAMKGNIPLVIKNTLSNCRGTIINNLGDKTGKRIITGITHMANRIQVRIIKDNNKGNCNYKLILQTLAENNISLDLINIFPDKKFFTIDSKDKSNLINILDCLSIKYDLVEDCSKVSIIGSGMKGIPGVMARIISTLDNEKIEVLQTADSHMTIWCLIHSDKVRDAIKILHKVFMQN
ncbi:aspartate kinase [Clostridium fallax]|uniref:Aspartokinase n=1 Tax=Clostridium fallax TaxID=1533 RepID=A0A1M4V410_9CLOT|nr:aspartate kinase [Clostridium fallax]SHE63618.1 aspartate kinase [Clostridium fallax]SQB06563.1 aspartate kinase I [Clostridium fallax]